MRENGLAKGLYIDNGKGLVKSSGLGRWLEKGGRYYGIPIEKKGVYAG